MSQHQPKASSSPHPHTKPTTLPPTVPHRHSLCSTKPRQSSSSRPQCPHQQTPRQPRSSPTSNSRLYQHWSHRVSLHKYWNSTRRDQAPDLFATSATYDWFDKFARCTWRCSKLTAPWPATSRWTGGAGRKSVDVSNPHGCIRMSASIVRFRNAIATPHCNWAHGFVSRGLVPHPCRWRRSRSSSSWMAFVTCHHPSVGVDENLPTSLWILFSRRHHFIWVWISQLNVDGTHLFSIQNIVSNTAYVIYTWALLDYMGLFIH